MNANSAIGLAQPNLLVAWTWILLGFISGMLMGLKFHQPDWLGGYASHKRRLYRLGHISFFGLGAVNLMFYFTVRGFPASTSLAIASGALITGALTMPVCCLLMAHWPKLRPLFAVPVISLLLGAGLTIARSRFIQPMLASGTSVRRLPPTGTDP